jgi:hypothetical protein
MVFVKFVQQLRKRWRKVKFQSSQLRILFRDNLCCFNNLKKFSEFHPKGSLLKYINDF